jgi:hypothetical protein
VTRTNPATLIATLCAAALLVTGCAAGPLANGPLDSDAEPSASVDAPDDTAPVITREECVIGTWQVDNAAFEAYMNSLIPSAGVRMTISGGNYMRFDDAGSFFSWRDDFTMTTTASGQNITHVSNSGETGDYGLVLDWGKPPTVDFLWVAETMMVVHDEVAIVGGIATLVDDGSGTATIDLFDGFTGEVPMMDGEPLEGSLPFTCKDDTLVFEFDAGLTMPYHRSSATR